MDGLFHSSRQWNVRDKRARKTKAISGGQHSRPVSKGTHLLSSGISIGTWWLFVKLLESVLKKNDRPSSSIVLFTVLEWSSNNVILGSKN